MSALDICATELKTSINQIWCTKEYSSQDFCGHAFHFYSRLVKGVPWHKRKKYTQYAWKKKWRKNVVWEMSAVLFKPWYDIDFLNSLKPISFQSIFLLFYKILNPLKYIVSDPLVVVLIFECGLKYFVRISLLLTVSNIPPPPLDIYVCLIAYYCCILGRPIYGVFYIHVLQYQFCAKVLLMANNLFVVL